MSRLLSSLTVICLFVLLGTNLRAHDVYIMNDNHTDYGWNATTEAYDQAMAAEIDYYLNQIAQFYDEPTESQARFSADCWWYLYNYEKRRSPVLFNRLIDAIRSGHITVPLNPFVLLYGAMSTEAAIRAGYYPGRMERKYGIRFRLAQNIENHTSPWGLASLWAGSGVEFSWKGVCGCATETPYQDHMTDVFRWRGPDGREILKKWYEFDTNNMSYGGYAEARSHLSSQGIDAAIRRTFRRAPELPVTGLFGGGHDDVAYMTDRFVETAKEWNRRTAAPEDRVIVSNGIDYFEALKPYAEDLPVLEGGWGADWDLWPAALSHWTTRMRNAFERLRSIEALMVIAGLGSSSSWHEDRLRLEEALTNYFKYFEHGWNGTSDNLKRQLLQKKKEWTYSFEQVVAAADEAATAAAARVFETGDDKRVVVINPLGFIRTDYADLPVADGEIFRVIDAVTGEEALSQTINTEGGPMLRFLAENVPALGYRQYRLAPGVPSARAPAAVIDESRIESDWYRIETGQSGEITGAIDKRAGRPMTASLLNFVAEGTVTRSIAESVGPVSATLRLDVAGEPDRIVRLTLFRDVDRLEIENIALGLPETELSYVFDFGLKNPRIDFEELGAIARPGLVAEGGNFLPGTNAEFMTLNHFVNVEDDGYSVTLSNWDAFAMRIGRSTPKRFDLPSSRIAVLGVGNPRSYGFEGQGGAEYFVNRFALSGHSQGFSGAHAMRSSLAHQNPLRVIALPPNQSGPLGEPSASLASVDAGNVVMVALKPAEEPDGGYVLRLWELEGRDTSIEIDVAAMRPVEAFETSLIETDRQPATLRDGKILATIAANEIKTFRLVSAAHAGNES